MKIYRVLKKDGHEAEFDISKIVNSIARAFDAAGKNCNTGLIEMIAIRVTADFQRKIRDGRISVEDIRDSAAKILLEAGYADVAEVYIVYHNQWEKEKQELVCA